MERRTEQNRNSITVIQVMMGITVSSRILSGLSLYYVFVMIFFNGELSNSRLLTLASS